MPASGETKHINSYFLFFRVASTPTRDAQQAPTATSSAAGDVAPSDNRLVNLPVNLPVNLHVVGKRGPRGRFEFSTADFTASVVRGLQDVQACGFALCRSDGPLQTVGAEQTLSQPATLNAVLTIHSGAQRKEQHVQPEDPEKRVDSNRGEAKQPDQATFELSLQLNAKLPLSLVNCVSATLSGEETHALGWVASSLKPVVAFAMCRLAWDAISPGERGRERHRGAQIDTESVSAPAVCLDFMCGEGTITLEGGSNGFFVLFRPIFLVATDPLCSGMLYCFGCRSRF